MVFLGELYGTPIPRQDVAAVRELAVRHSIPRHPARTAMLPNMSESSGTPGARTALGVFLPQCFPAEPCPRLTLVMSSEKPRC